MHCIRGRNQQSPAPQAPPTTNHQQHQQGQWRQARGGRSAESTGVLTFLGCITMPYWNNWYLQKWFFVNEVMVLLYIIVLSFFDHLFSCLPATEIDSQWMSTNSRVLWLMQFKKILRKDVTELRDARAFSFPWLTMVYGGCGVAGLPYFCPWPHGTSFWQRTVCSGMKVNPILGPENEKEDSFPALRYYRLQHLKPVTNCTRCSAIGATVIPGEF